MFKFEFHLPTKRWLTPLILLIFVVVLILGQPKPSLAASGGRIGGGSFRAPSPSIPRGGNYGGRGYGGYGGYGGYRSGGMGFPFILPIFGFGGGGLFGFLILMSIAGVIVNSIRGSKSPRIESSSPTHTRTSGPVTLIQLQIGLLAAAKDLQKDLRELASSADTNTSNGLQRVLQETTLSLLRQPNLWVYANLENGQVPFNSAEATFNRLSLTERSKLTAELTSNFSGKILSEQNTGLHPGEAAQTNEYIAITLLVASRSNLGLSDCASSEQLQGSLQKLGSITSADLMALEVIWQPDGSEEVLSSEDLVTAYPNLKHL